LTTLIESGFLQRNKNQEDKKFRFFAQHHQLAVLPKIVAAKRKNMKYR
jgi:hypothetical protein